MLPFQKLLHRGGGEGATPFTGLLYFTLHTYLILLNVSKEVSSTIFKVFGMTRPGTEPRTVFVWHKRFKEGRESVRDDESCGRSKQVSIPQLIGQTVRVRVTMLRF